MPIAIGATFIAGAIATFELQGRWLKSWCSSGGPSSCSSAPRRACSLCLFAQRRQGGQRAAVAALARHRGARQRRELGLAGGVFFRSLSDEQQVFLAFLFAGMASVGIPVYAASWPIFALYAAGILGPSSTCCLRSATACSGDRAAGAAFLRDQRSDRLPADAGLPFRLPAAPGLRKADKGPPPPQPAPRAPAGRAGGGRRQVEASGRKLALFAERAPIAVLELQPNGTVAEVNRAPKSCSALPPPSWSAQARKS